jgi:ATP-dependent RNA helicase DDX23/PRP28
LDAIAKVGYKDPTPIQRQAIPVGLQGRDIMGIAETGSGKTAAFVLPMLQYILNLPKMSPETEIDGPYALILAPTRELAVQIEQETIKFARYCDIRTVCLVGGTPIEEQAFALRHGCEIVIATPGRINDCIESRYLVLNQCTYVVLDEADRMIDMGFEPQVNSVLDAMPVTNLKAEDEHQAAQQENLAVKGLYRTTIMYSATMPVGVERLARKYLRRPVHIIIGEIGKAVEKIEQRVEWVKDDSWKLKKLMDVLTEGPPPPYIIFMNQKKNCDYVAKKIESQLGLRTTSLHSGRGQQQREIAIEGFKAGRYDVLVSTDVAGRGIDVKGVTHVVNYDMTKTIEGYTHRIGRTGRAGAIGLATSFVTPEDTEVMYDLKTMLTNSGNPCPLELTNHPAAQYKPGTVPDKKPRRDTIIYAK